MLETFKSRWEIQKNWQLLFPVRRLIGLGYSAYKLSLLFTKSYSIFITIGLAFLFFYILLKLTLFIFKKLEHKWILDHKWEMIRVFIVFAITGSSSMFIGRPIMKLIGITKENLHPSLYWILYILIGFIFYQILLVLIGWIFGQYQFFWDFEKKMLRRMKLGFIFGNEK